MKIAFRFKENQPMANWLAIVNQLKRELNKDSLDDIVFTANIQQLRKPKTFSQNRYFHSEGFIGRIITGYREAGYDVPRGREMAIDWVKYQIKTHPDIMFYEKKENVLTGETRYETKSFSKATKEEMSYIIEWCIRTYANYFGIVLETAEEYKRKLKSY